MRPPRRLPSGRGRPGGRVSRPPPAGAAVAGFVDGQIRQSRSVSARDHAGSRTEAMPRVGLGSHWNRNSCGLYRAYPENTLVPRGNEVDHPIPVRSIFFEVTRQWGGIKTVERKEEAD